MTVPGAATGRERAILELARALTRRHGVELPIRWSRARTRLAAVVFCRSSGRALEMRLSRPLLTRLDAATVRDAILHEIAHAHAGVRAGHGPAWKAAAERVGARPARTTHVPEHVRAALASYRATCRRCGAHLYLHRRPKHPLRTYRHGAAGCGGSLHRLERLGPR